MLLHSYQYIHRSQHALRHVFVCTYPRSTLHISEVAPLLTCTEHHRQHGRMASTPQWMHMIALAPTHCVFRSVTLHIQMAVMSLATPFKWLSCHWQHPVLQCIGSGNVSITLLQTAHNVFAHTGWAPVHSAARRHRSRWRRRWIRSHTVSRAIRWRRSRFRAQTGNIDNILSPSYIPTLYFCTSNTIFMPRNNSQMCSHYSAKYIYLRYFILYKYTKAHKYL